MKTKYYTLLILFFISFKLISENPSKEDYYIPPISISDLNSNFSNTRYSISNTYFSKSQYQPRQLSYNGYQFQMPYWAQHDYLTLQSLKYTPLTFSNSHTFGMYGGNINKYLSWSSYAEHEYLPGLALSNKLGGNFIFQPTHKLSIILNSEFYKSQQTITPYQDIQFNGLISYKITPYLKLSGFGNYSVNGTTNYHNGALPMMGYNAGYSGVGGTVDLRVINTEHFEIWINSGMEYLFNPEKNKFEWTPVIVPEIVFK